MNINPRSAQVHTMLGKGQGAQNDFEEARKASTRRWTSSRLVSMPSMELAALHKRRGEFDTAISFADAASRRPARQSRHACDARTHVDGAFRGLPRAEKEVKALLERYPAQAAVHALWGDIRF